MIVSLIAGCVALLILTFVFAVLYLGERREVRRLCAERDRVLDRFREETNRLHVTLDDQRRDSIALQQQRDAQHEAEITRLHDVHTSGLERLMSMQQFGTSRPPEAVVTEPEPDAETRMLRGITQDMIDHGAAALQAEYENRGIIVPIEELRDEAHSMILGVGFKPSTDRTLKVVD